MSIPRRDQRAALNGSCAEVGINLAHGSAVVQDALGMIQKPHTASMASG